MRTLPDTDLAVIRWRERLLRAAGLPQHLARALARDDRYDLNQILGLLEHGCPPATAVEIAAPVEDRQMP
jgi:hypothetical protein